MLWLSSRFLDFFAFFFPFNLFLMRLFTSFIFYLGFRKLMEEWKNPPELFIRRGIIVTQWTVGILLFITRIWMKQMVKFLADHTELVVVLFFNIYYLIHVGLWAWYWFFFFLTKGSQFGNGGGGERKQENAEDSTGGKVCFLNIILNIILNSFFILSIKATFLLLWPRFQFIILHQLVSCYLASLSVFLFSKMKNKSYVCI